MLLHFGLKTFDVGFELIFTKYQFGQIQRESKGVVKTEHLFAIHFCRTGGFEVFHTLFEHFDARFEGTDKGFLFFLNHFFHQVLLSFQFGISRAHYFGKGGNQFIQKGTASAQESIGVTHRTAQNSANNVAGPGVGRQLSVGDGKGDGAYMVGHHPHGNVGLLVTAVWYIAEIADFFDQRLKQIGIVIGGFALNCHTQAFEAHTGIDVFGRQHLEGTVCLAVELHKHQVPDFHHPGVIFVDQVQSVQLSPLLLGT